ncbi:MAG: F0F1 ATP synthase subunit epsilon [Peptococcaceae bacterium]|jgi:F-type H+-transporting ATPase subunit epsilon|nr:F0F1 ATP synthase subunit epsilon [Peptococcaceae bacterium]MDH7523713.1 F0F1 ATP synthase subunit epsilon [Peptococcaceae bacterium]
MAKTLHLDVVTPDRTILSEEVESLIAPAVEGYMGVLPDHAPMIVGLVPGVFTYRRDNKPRHLAVGGGFMEIARNRVILLADSAERPEEIDRERAAAARERAEKRLKERPPGLDVERAELALKRALARLRVSERL